MILGLLSDIHEDRLNLQRAIRLLEKQGADTLICLGDIAGFSKRYFNHSKTRSAKYCWQSVREHCEIVIPGNHDYYAVKKITPWMAKCGIPENWYQLPFKEREKKAQGQFWLYEPDECENDLDDQMNEYISQLPAWQKMISNDETLMLSHYVSPDLNGAAAVFLPDPSLISTHLDFMRRNKQSISVFGHMHPEGLLRIHPDGYTRIRFHKIMNLQEQTAWGIPCVAGGRNRPGIALLDTTAKTIKTVPLYSRLTSLIR